MTRTTKNTSSFLNNAPLLAVAVLATFLLLPGLAHAGGFVTVVWDKSYDGCWALYRDGDHLRSHCGSTTTLAVDDGTYELRTNNKFRTITFRVSGADVRVDPLRGSVSGGSQTSAGSSSSSSNHNNSSSSSSSNNQEDTCCCQYSNWNAYPPRVEYQVMAESSCQNFERLGICHVTDFMCRR